MSKDNSQEVIEIVKDDKKPQSLIKILIIMFVSIVVLATTVIGGFKFYKQYKNKKVEPIKQSLLIEQNNTYVEVLAAKIPGPPKLEIPKYLEKPRLIEKIENNITDTTDYSTLLYEKSKIEVVLKEKTLEEKLEQILSFDELIEAINSLEIRRVDNMLVVGDKSYRVDETLGSNFIIKKMYRNGNVKIFNIKENYSRRFSL
ncbi:MAG: Unknown protein [uncultured Sulfurovum sp.]|uniref:Uncharacterized protein n=1 Tax=uncultured Sulfurovum sp. TaxID=269237 RepID=A0A6S6S687_9BACT|nr:MAG: Unknown protein [uncultured Sulfurovum sp.]